MTRPAGEITGREYILFFHKPSIGVCRFDLFLLTGSRLPTAVLYFSFALQQRILLEFDESLDV